MQAAAKKSQASQHQNAPAEKPFPRGAQLQGDIEFDLSAICHKRVFICTSCHDNIEKSVHRLFTAEYEKKLEVAMGNRDESSKRDMIAMSPPSELVTISVYCAKALAEKRLASYPNRTAAATFCFDYTLEENQRSFFDTQSKEDAETFGMLHKLGFVIIRHPKPHELMNWAEVQQELFQFLSGDTAEKYHIFETSVEQYAETRSQALLKEESRPKAVKKVLDVMAKCMGRVRTPWHKTSLTCNVVESQPDGPAQRAHSDCTFYEDPVRPKKNLHHLSAALLTGSVERLPLQALTAVQPGTKLWIWPGSIDMHEIKDQRIEPELLDLETGDIIVFRPDFFHAGASYKERHVRVHAYIDSLCCDRPEDSTHPVEEGYVTEKVLRTIVDNRPIPMDES